MRPRPQEKSAPKPDIDAAVNELKELKIALEEAVKARCGGCWIATTLWPKQCAHPTRRCVTQAATEENQKEGKAKCVPGGHSAAWAPHLTRCALRVAVAPPQGGVPLEAGHAA